MNKRLFLVMAPLLLAGCLEVEQHPRWVDGRYAGKVDQQPYQVHFHRDRLSWWAALNDRNQRQNEFNRANP